MHVSSLKIAMFAGWAAIGLCAAGAAAAEGSDGWSRPHCRSISGAPNITLTKDEGATLKKTQGQMVQYSYAFGLVPLGTADTMLAAVGSRILRSTDVGCTWLPLADLTGQTGNSLLILESAGGSRAYGWAMNGNALATIDGDTATVSSVPGSGVTGLHVTPGHSRQLRFGDADGTIWSSSNGGADWARSGGIAGNFVYRTAFDPADPDHIVVGTMSNGAYTSFDGGRTWRRALGLVPSKTAVNIFNVVVSPANPKVVWAQGIDLAESDAGASSEGRHVYRSGDGGLSFERVVDQDDRVTLINGPLMVAHPTDESVLYFVFGTSFMGYGTDLYRYDYETRQVTLTHNSYSEISAIAFHPLDPGLMYLGLADD